ncbi:hypothetical protein [Chryseobacterium sp. ON_d1]|nr:hypothetical protein [Chryseobacterium sp. ON_d1]
MKKYFYHFFMLSLSEIQITAVSNLYTEPETILDLTITTADNN